jgi:hypothetical protein
MAQVTKEGRNLAFQVINHTDTKWEQWGDIQEVISLMLRHSKTYRRLIEMECGDGIHSGEWVNDNWEWIEKRHQQVEARLADLVDALPKSYGKPITAQIGGDPRGWVMRLFVPTEQGHDTTVGIY